MISELPLKSNPKRQIYIFISLLLVHSVSYVPLIVSEGSGLESIPKVHNKTNDSSYAVFDQSVTWDAAKSYCESQDGHLVTITTNAEQELVHSMIQGRSYGVWIGLSDERIEGTWEWITGEELSYTNWANGEPDGVDYAIMHDGSGQWDGPFETGTLPFVCEWDDYQTIELTQNSNTTQNNKSEPFTSIIDRIFLFIFFVGAFLGISYYKRKIT